MFEGSVGVFLECCLFGVAIFPEFLAAWHWELLLLKFLVDFYHCAWKPGMVASRYGNSEYCIIFSVIWISEVTNVFKCVQCKYELFREQVVRPESYFHWSCGFVRHLVAYYEAALTCWKRGWKGEDLLEVLAKKNRIWGESLRSNKWLEGHVLKGLIPRKFRTLLSVGSKLIVINGVTVVQPYKWQKMNG